MISQWRSACRALFLRASFSVAAIIILSVGIGATTTLFSVIDTVLWKSLPYPQADRLVTIFEANPAKNQNTSLVAPARIEDWNRLSASFDAISGSYSENVTDTSGSDPVRLSGRRVAPRFFSVYGTPALLGRTFAPEEKSSAVLWSPSSVIGSGRSVTTPIRESSASVSYLTERDTRSWA